MQALLHGCVEPGGGGGGANATPVALASSGLIMPFCHDIYTCPLVSDETIKGN